ncbi:putative sarm1 [Schistosoma mansoni]|uniref:putative sarm1 n=1 Tax=Schistosoma mansoni TaxID=6183 RepID=UPI0001A62FBB|nr:putative sarm1 [Schistosoma mansoni]|eukprot:XP_018648156.1 putative sarm1 [Schistosoma mansoni]
MNSQSTSSKHDELREHIFDYSNYFSTEDENSNWKRSTSDASFFLDGKLPIDECDTSGNVSEQARVYWNLPEAVEASVTPSCGLDRSQRSYEVRKLEKVSTGSATSRVQVHRVHFQEHNLTPIMRKDGTNRSQSTSFTPFQNIDSARLLRQFQDQQQQKDYNLDSTRLLSVQHRSKSDTNQSISSSSKFVLRTADHQSDLTNSDAIIMGNTAVKKEYSKESTTSSLSSVLNNRLDTFINHTSDNVDNKIFNDINPKSNHNFQVIEQKMKSEMEKLRHISSSPFTVSSSSSLSTIVQPLDNIDNIITTMPTILQDNNSVLVRNEKDMNRLNEEYKTIVNCEYWLNKARQACENQADLNVLTADLIKPDGLLETIASRLIKPIESTSEAPTIDLTQNIHEQYSHNDDLKTSEIFTESTDNVDGKPVKLLSSTSSDLNLPKVNQYNEANRRVVIGSARLLGQILSENHLLEILDKKLVSQKHSNFSPKDEFDKVDKLIIQKQECSPYNTSPTYDNDYEKSIDTNGTTKLSSPTTISSTQNSLLYNDKLPSYGHITSLLKNIIGKCWEYREDVDIYREYLGILEPLLKHTETMCDTVVENGGLRSLIYACRSSDLPSLRHAAVCLMSLALFGGSGSHSEMMRQHAIEWLFCLAFHQDEVIRYFACLTSAVLSTNPELTAAVNASCTLDLVMPFVRSHSPIEFARQQLVAAFQHTCKNSASYTSESQTSFTNNQSDTTKYCCENRYTGGTADWLKRLIPVMFSKQFEPRVLVAFHFAVEATLKSDMKCSQVFYESDIVEILRNVVCSSTFLESKFAAMALHILGEDIPCRLPAQVPLWDYAEVECWLTRRGFEDLASKFSKLRVDGDLLLRLDEFKLEKDLGLENGITRSRLLRELCSLKINADYSAVDPTGISAWLREATRITALNNTNTPRNPMTSDYVVIKDDFQWTMASTNASEYTSKYCYTHDLSCLNQSFDLLQYTYNFISAGVHCPFLPYLSDKMLLEDCHIKNGIHRKRILEAIQSSISIHNQLRLTDNDSKLNASSKPNKYIDIFISYRRSTGSQLASLLKVHFHLRGYRVFLDIDRLTAGKFHESLLHSIRSSYNFVLVLTPRALDRCLNDIHCTDWIHKEVVCALESGCNIIPITDNFTWPLAESLPEDLRSITTYNAVNWIHDYQEACIDKVEKFMIKPITSTPLPCSQIKPFEK